MNKKIEIINEFKSNEEYFNRYAFALNYNKHKFVNKEDLKKQKSGKFYKLNNNLYVKLPFYTKKIATLFVCLASLLIVGGIGATVAIFYMPHTVTLNSNYLEISKSNTARLASDYKCTFKIKDEYLPTQYMNQIYISSIKSNGNEIPVEDYSFIYQTNAKNELTINKKHLGSNIEINVDMVKRQSQHNSYFFEYEQLEEYASFSNFKINCIGEVSVDNPLECLDDIEHFNLDNIKLNAKFNAAKLSKEIITKYELPFSSNVMILREDNTYEFEILANENIKTLPKNIWLRSNARYTKKDEDFTLTYSTDYRKATLKIPYFFIRDNGSIKLNPDEEP